MDWITTSTLLQNLEDYGNHAAWDAFIARFQAPVVNFARRLGVGESDAEDVAQQTLLAFATAFRAGRYQRDKGRLSSWLFGIAKNQVRDQWRRDRRPEVHAPTRTDGGDFLEQAEDPRAGADLWERIWDDFLVSSCLRRAREEFSPQTFRVFELVALEEMTPQEAADTLSLPLKSVYNAKHRVLTRIREIRLEMEGVEPPEPRP